MAMLLKHFKPTNLQMFAYFMLRGANSKQPMKTHTNLKTYEVGPFYKNRF